MTATALRVFLTTSHPKMPNLILTPAQIADVTAYTVSLRKRQRSELHITHEDSFQVYLRSGPNI
jgi:hypothetical protein